MEIATGMHKLGSLGGYNVIHNDRLKPVDSDQLYFDVCFTFWRLHRFTVKPFGFDESMTIIADVICTCGCEDEGVGNNIARSINLTRFTSLDPGSLFLRNKSYWIHEGPSKSVQVSSCGVIISRIKTLTLCMWPWVLLCKRFVSSSLQFFLISKPKVLNQN